jgi:2-polyprenyl-3-methyl-5-hydroxy-6-metoxy-1,4-benzoquinol methylase
MKYFNLNTEEEFRVRYYVSRIGFDDIWSSKDRTTRESAAAFYNEHDADLWRQAYLSKFRYTYKKKTLLAYHIAKRIGATHILDYGCGAGVVPYYLKQKGFVVDVADVPSPTLEFARKQLGFNAVFAVDSSLKLPTAQYELVTCLCVLEHTFNPLEITKTLLESLKPHGVLYVLFPNEEGRDEDHHKQHTPEAQLERAAVFEYLRKTCDELLPEEVYKKH